MSSFLTKVISSYVDEVLISCVPTILSVWISDEKENEYVPIHCDDIHDNIHDVL